MKKGIIAGLVVLALLFGGIFTAVYVTEDRTGPQIVIPDGDAVYVEGQDTQFLLEGVTAVDAKDGDVAASLRVEKVIPEEDGVTASVAYVAKDNSNNVTRIHRVVSYIADPAAAPQTQPTDPGVTEGEPQTPPEGDGQTPEGGDEQPQTGQGENPDATATGAGASSGEAANDAAIAALPAGSPKFYLTQYEVTVEKGSDFDGLSYVKSIEDNKDTRERLYRNIQIDGKVDTDEAGEYTLTYHVVDSDSNRSNDAVLKVTVQ